VTCERESKKVNCHWKSTCSGFIRLAHSKQAIAS
jgi:hypothetical protein